MYLSELRWPVKRGAKKVHQQLPHRVGPPSKEQHKAKPQAPSLKALDQNTNKVKLNLLFNSCALYFWPKY